jgi:hypothetical protein
MWPERLSLAPLRSKLLELPPAVARAFVRDMRAFHAEKSPIKRDEIASRQIHVLRQFLRTRENNILAEGVGFEPTVPLQARRFSRPVP